MWFWPTPIPEGSTLWRAMNDGRFDWTMAVVAWTEDGGRTLRFIGMVGAVPPLRELIAVRDKSYPLARRALFERVDPITGEVSQHEWVLPPPARAPLPVSADPRALLTDPDVWRIAAIMCLAVMIAGALGWALWTGVTAMVEAAENVRWTVDYTKGS